MEQALGSRTGTLCEEGHLEKRCDLGLREGAAQGDTEGGSQKHKDPDLIPSSLWSLVETAMAYPSWRPEDKRVHRCGPHVSASRAQARAEKTVEWMQRGRQTASRTRTWVKTRSQKTGKLHCHEKDDIT